MFKSHFRLLLPLVLCGGLLTARSAPAQALSPELPITTPHGATIGFELDARQDDVLGVLKNVMVGAQKMLTDQQGGPLATAYGPNSGEAQILRSLKNLDLEKVLKGVNHVHIMAYTPSPTEKPLDLAAQYEPEWTGEGGHRLALVNGGAQQGMVMYGFNDPHSFAIAAQAPDAIIVVRADGYPDLGELVPVLGMLYFGMAPRAMPESGEVTPAVAPVAMAAPPMKVRSSPAKPKALPAKRSG